jgi:hypothetical protein
MFFFIFHTIGPTDPFHPSPATFQTSSGISGLLSEVSGFQHHTKPCSKCGTFLVLPFIEVQFAGEMVLFLLNAAFAMAILY